MTKDKVITQPSRRPRLRFFIALLCLAAAGLFCLFKVLGPASEGNPQLAGSPVADQNTELAPAPSDVGASVADSQPFKETLGILVNGIHLAVGGTRLNLRYVVVNTNRAGALTNKLYGTYLLDSKGKPLALPTGPLASPVQDQSGQLARAGYTYSRFFPNPNHAVKPGDQVTLVIGNLREDLVVQ